MEYKKTKLSLISNTIFLSFSIFLLTFIWINFYTRDLSLSIFLALIFSIIFTIFYIVYINNKLNKETITKSNKLRFETIKNHLILGKHEDVSNLIFTLFNISKVEKISNSHFKSENKDIFLFFENILENQHLISILKNRTSNDIDIYCINYNVDIEVENININYMSIENIIVQINNLNLKIPNLTQLKIKQKATFSQVLKVILNKQRSKNYLLFGFFLIFTSLFTPFTIYYTIMGTILIILSIYSRFNHRFNN